MGVHLKLCQTDPFKILICFRSSLTPIMEVQVPSSLAQHISSVLPVRVQPGPSWAPGTLTPDATIHFFKTNFFSYFQKYGIPKHPRVNANNG